MSIMTTEPEQPREALALVDPGAHTDLLWSTAGLDHAQRAAKLFAASELVPKHFRNRVSDVTIALLMSRLFWFGGHDPAGHLCRAE